MKKTKALLAVGILFSITQVSALEFGGMGNISASMGGAGVALKNSQWGLYYNPALLGTTRKYRFAYSFGATISEKNLLSLASINVKNLTNLPNQVTGLFGTTTTSTQQSSTSATSMALAGATSVGSALASTENDTLKLPNGYFGNVIKNLLKNSGTNIEMPKQEDLTKFLNQISGNGTSGANGTSSDLENAIKKFKEVATSNPSSILDKTKEAFLKASAASGGNALFDTIVKNLDPKSVSGISELLKEATANGGGVDVSKVLSTLNGITLSHSGDASLDEAIKDIGLIQDTLRHNNFSFSTQNGLVFQTKPNDDVGGFAVGLFGSAFASGSASFDDTHNRIIVEAGSKYFELGISGGNVSINAVGNGSSNGNGKSTYENSSVFSDQAKHHISIAGLVLGEVPVGYGHNFSVGVGELSIGMTLKYIYGMGYKVSKTGSFSTLSGISFGTTPEVSHSFGIDLGALYSLGGFSLGVVAKNINNPALKIDETQKIYLNPQLRAGLAYELGILNLAFDADLLPNHTLSYNAPKNQMVGGGVMLDFKKFDFRAGVMYDIQNPLNEGVILTGGINLFGFLDIAIQSNLHLTKISGYSIPSYFSVRVGGGFSW